MLCLYHGDEYWRHAVSWVEHRVEGGNVVPLALHIVCTNDSGRVVHLRRPPTEARYLYPTKVTTTVAQFVAYLCRRLTTVGGTAWEILGVERPEREQIESGPNEELTETYQRAARLLGSTVPELQKKYGHLNNGLQMMNLKNRLRAKGHNT